MATFYLAISAGKFISVSPGSSCPTPLGSHEPPDDDQPSPVPGGQEDALPRHPPATPVHALCAQGSMRANVSTFMRANAKAS